MNPFLAVVAPALVSMATVVMMVQWWTALIEFILIFAFAAIVVRQKEKHASRVFQYDDHATPVTSADAIRRAMGLTRTEDQS